MNDPKGVDLKDPEVKDKSEPTQDQETQDMAEIQTELKSENQEFKNIETGTNKEKSKKLKIVDEGQELKSLQRAKNIKKIRTKRERKSSIKNKLIFIVFLTVIFVWVFTAIVLNGFIWHNLVDYNSNTLLNRLEYADTLFLIELGDEIIQDYISGFKVGNKGFAGILDKNGEELYIGKGEFNKSEIVNIAKQQIRSKPREGFTIDQIVEFFNNDPYVKTIELKESNNIGFVVVSTREVLRDFVMLVIAANIILIIAGLLVVFIFINIFLKILLVSPFITLINKTNIVRTGDLTVQFGMKRKDEVGSVANAFNDTVGTLKDLVQKVYIAVIIMTKILRGLFSSSKAVTESANAQAITIEQTRGNFEQLNKMVETITKESTKANSYTVQALDKARIGMQSIQSLEKEMQTIESSSLEITDIITLINDIAEQTELLSLNASIESARAGEAGKGFNVVAGEVRKLAEKSTQAANRIYELITNNQRIIKVGVNYSKNATRVLRDIAMSNELSAGLVKTISEEIQRVKQSSNEILGVINYISEIAQANLIESENVAQSTKDLTGQAVNLQEFVGKFDVRPEKIKENQNHIEEILKAKLLEVEDILKEYGTAFLQTGSVLDIGEYKVKELQLGKKIVTNNNELVDIISKRTQTSVSFFQSIENVLIRVATTIKNYDDSRATGTIISPEEKIYKTVIDGKNFYGRAFVVNRWYVGVYRPIIDQTGYVLGVLYLGLPEEAEMLKEVSTEKLQEESIIVDTTFKHSY